ncbi:MULTISPECIES: GGDEF domain-containing protein [unclassified Minwuia]|uniref:GGDEF domain-containing protein n=1 Tax=unclassified Minwuia TaxID=2618799 RepID=UPI00247A3B9F|nr:MULTISPECIES: GGDEF domain-containing protein [unclassified Minwuia]
MDDVGSVGGQWQFEDFQIFPWHPSFNTGNEIIDDQHRNLVILLNRLAYSLIQDEDIELDDQYRALHDYASVHFHDEEKIWMEHFGDDPWFIGHRKSHENFLVRLEDIRNRFADKSSEQEVEEIVRFLIRWLASHIIESDKKMYFVILDMDSGYSIESAKRNAEIKMGGEIQDLIDAVLNMYENLSKTTLYMIQERNSRIRTEEMLKAAYRKLEVISVTDQLTGLFNRHQLDNMIDREIRRAARNKERVALYMIDIDYFKKYNDFYGHLAGDEALKKVADTLRQTCARPGDFLFRFGGEEFCVVIMQANEESIIPFGNRIRAAVEARSIPHETNPNSRFLTISIGAVTWIPKPGEEIKEYFEHADRALYESKRKGRNFVTMNV